MAAAATPPGPVLGAEESKELHELFNAADSVELKLTVPEASQRSAVAALGIDPLDAQIRQVFFLDTPDLSSTRAVWSPGQAESGSRRLGREAASGGPAELPEPFRHRGHSVSRSMCCLAATCARLVQGRATRWIDVGEAVSGKRAAAQVVHEEPTGALRRARARRHRARRPPVLGPINVLKLKFSPADFERNWSRSSGSTPTGGGSWSSRPSARRPRGSRLPPRPRPSSATAGIDITGEQQTKTSTALKFFSDRRKRRRRLTRLRPCPLTTGVSTSTSSVTRSPRTRTPPAGRTTPTGP